MLALFGTVQLWAELSREFAAHMWDGMHWGRVSLAQFTGPAGSTMAIPFCDRCRSTVLGTIGQPWMRAWGGDVEVVPPVAPFCWGLRVVGE